MNNDLSFSQFFTRFPDDDTCLEEIRRLRFPNGIICKSCHTKTKHYKIRNRTAYSCKRCRNHVYPLAGTIFEKTTTPLRLWFYLMYIMTQTKADISIKQLQRELGVTYKTAWRMYHYIYQLMEQNNGDLLIGTSDNSQEQNTVRKWVFFNAIEFKVSTKQEKSESE